MSAPVQIASVVRLSVEESAATDNDPAVSTEYAAVVGSFKDTIGVEPGMVDVCLCEKTPGTVSRLALQDKPATLHLDNVLKFTGFVKSVRKSLQDRSVYVTLLDKRCRLGKTDVGVRHLGANGIPVIGADIRFNEFGEPNMAVTDDDDGFPQFVHELPDDGVEPDCATVEAVFWTYGKILKWLWHHYVDDIALPTIPASGGLEKKAAQMNFLGVPVNAAIQAVLNETNTTMGMNANGTVFFWSRATPPTTATVRFVNEGGLKSATEYTLEYPESFTSEVTTAATVTDAYIVGGREVREINSGAADYYDGIAEISLDPQPPSQVAFFVHHRPGPGDVPPGDYSIDFIFQLFTNFSGQPRKRYGFRADRYAAHGAGKDIRRKDRGKRLSGQMLLARDKEGNYVNPENECAVTPVSASENLAALYPFGSEIDLDHAQVIANDPSAITDKPTNLPLTIDSEVRQYVQATNNPDSLPTTERLIVRDEFVHKTRESIQVGVPVSGIVLIDAATNPWAVANPPAFNLPAGWTDSNDYSGVGGIPTGTGGPGRFLAIVPAGVVVDGISPLNEIKDIVASELGRPSSVVTGTFPRWVNLPVGTKITAVGGTKNDANGMELIGDEVVIGIEWDGRSQRYSFVATNHFGMDAVALAQAFVDRRRFRRGA